MMVISHFVRAWFGWVVAVFFASGCQFSSFNGEADTDTDTDEAGGTEEETGAGSDPGATSSPTSMSGDTSQNTTEAEDSSTGATETCELFTQWHWAVDVDDDATSLIKTEAMVLPPYDDEPVTFLRATQSMTGSAPFSFEMPCADTVVLWALAWDAAGDNPANADAFTVGIDLERGEEGALWEYGCDNEERGWQWFRIRETGEAAEACEEGGLLEPLLEEGDHQLVLTNPELISNMPMLNFTGIAAVVVTNDPAYDPVADYDPTPR